MKVIDEDNRCFKDIVDVLSLCYPISSAYVNFSDSRSPNEIFGFGTWERLKDRFIYALGDGGNVGDTGGSATHSHTQSSTTGSTTLTAAQSGLPNHRHGLRDAFSEGGNAVMQAGSIYPFSVDQSNAYTAYSGGQNASQGHTHTLGSTNSASSMPPYIKAYIWKRVA